MPRRSRWQRGVDYDLDRQLGLASRFEQRTRWMNAVDHLIGVSPRRAEGLGRILTSGLPSRAFGWPPLVCSLVIAAMAYRRPRIRKARRALRRRAYMRMLEMLRRRGLRSRPGSRPQSSPAAFRFQPRVRSSNRSRLPITTSATEEVPAAARTPTAFERPRTLNSSPTKFLVLGTEAGRASNRCRALQATAGGCPSRAAAFVHHEDTVGALDRREAMRDDDRGSAFHQPAQRLTHPDLRVVSTLDVASSRIRICGLCARARAKLISCFWPVEKPAPRSRPASPTAPVIDRSSPQVDLGRRPSRWRHR